MLRVQAGGWLGEELSPRTFLEAQAETNDPPQGGPVPLLGQDIALLLTPGRGVSHLWELGSGEAAPAAVLGWLYSGEKGPWATSGRDLSFTWNRSGWSRVTHVTGPGAAGKLEEVGLLFREGPVVVVQHRWLDDPPPDFGAPRVRVLGPARAVEAALPLLLPLRARQLQAAAGGWSLQPALPSSHGGSLQNPSQGDSLQVQTDVSWGKTLNQALAVVESAAVPPHFLGGVETRSQGSRPVLLAADALAEVGLALVLMGETQKAWAALEALLQDDVAASPRSLLLLAARWALATGNPTPLLPLRGALERATASALESSHPPGSGGWGGRALPPLIAVLEELATAVEPLGKGGWAGALRHTKREHLELMRESLERTEKPLQPPPETPVNSPGHVALPVLGGPSAIPSVASAVASAVPSAVPSGIQREPDHPDAHETLLPNPTSFASPLLPVFLPRRTLQAARLVRSVLEGVLGVGVEGALGRMVLAPRLPKEMGHLEVSGLGVAGARVTFNYRRAEGAHTFHLLQTEGGIPVNLTLRVTLESVPADSRMEVTMGGEPVEVEGVPSNGNWGFQLQFPLDPERTLRVAAHHPMSGGMVHERDA